MKKQNIYARVSPEIIAKLKLLAQSEQTNFNQIITSALESYLFSKIRSESKGKKNKSINKTLPIVPPLPASTITEILTHQLKGSVSEQISTDDDILMDWY